MIHGQIRQIKRIMQFGEFHKINQFSFENSPQRVIIWNY